MTELLTKDKQLGSEALKELSEIRLPLALLGTLPDDEIPDCLYPLAMAARMLSNFAIYDDPVIDKARALRIIKQVRRELGYAEERCKD